MAETVKTRAINAAYKASESEFIDSPYVLAWAETLEAFALAEIQRVFEATRDAASKQCNIGFVIDGSKYTAGSLDAANLIQDNIRALTIDDVMGGGKP